MEKSAKSLVMKPQYASKVQTDKTKYTRKKYKNGKRLLWSDYLKNLSE